MYWKIMLVTPSMAKSILEKNFKNRRIDHRRVERYANDMKNGLWKTNTGEPMKITKSGRFGDGQHRLLGLIKANVSIEFEFRTGVDDDVFDVIDTGKSRSTSDIFHLSDIKNGVLISSLLNAYLNLRKGMTSNKNTYIPNTSHDILSYYNQSPKFYQIIGSQTKSWYGSFGRILSTSMIGSFYLLFRDIDEDDAEMFMNQLCTGADITNNSILLLRGKLINDKTSRVNKMPMKLKAALIIKTWNYFRKNQHINLLKFTDQTEEFPKPI